MRKMGDEIGGGRGKGDKGEMKVEVGVVVTGSNKDGARWEEWRDG